MTNANSYDRLWLLTTASWRSAMWILVNALTALRLVGVLWLWYHLCSSPPDPHSEAWMWVLIGATDFFDGYLARRFNVTSEFGSTFDATVDKVATLSLIPIVLYRGYPMAPAIGFLVISLIAVWQAVLYRREAGVFPVSRLGGKVAIALWGISVIPVLLVASRYVTFSLILISSISLLYALLDYFKAYGWRRC